VAKSATAEELDRRFDAGEDIAEYLDMSKATRPGVAQKVERQRIVAFLRAVYESSTHGASGLFERAIEAVERDDMSDPTRIASGR
jgi:hypothetical protein